MRLNQLKYMKKTIVINFEHETFWVCYSLWTNCSFRAAGSVYVYQILLLL